MKPSTLIPSLAVATLLAACGGGGNSDVTVTTMQSGTARYSQPLTVTVSGYNLTSTELEMVVDGPCVDVVPVGTPTATQAQFSCTVKGFEAITPRIRAGGRQVASLRVNAALQPQVTIVVTDGTRVGTFKVALDIEKAPITVDNFLYYVNQGFYTNTVFHRVIADFVVQGGGYTTTGSQKEPLKPAIKNEASNGLSNVRGTIAMARTDEPDSATSQFYLNLVDNPSLNPGGVSAAGYAVFGHVISGIEVVDEIGKVPTRSIGGFPNLPVTQVRIAGATQSQ